LHSDAKPYADATIELARIRVKDVHPCQFYALYQTLDRIKDIYHAFNKLGIDIFDLEGYLTYRTRNESVLHTLLPVIIEDEYKDNTGTVVSLLVDGLNRMCLARRIHRRKILAVRIKHVNRVYPLPAFPNEHGWSDVRQMEVLPDPQDKRRWRFPIGEAYNYYRDFNSAFGNVGQPREKKPEKE